MEFRRGNGFWSTRTNSGTTSTRGNADSNGPDGNFHSTSTCTSASRTRTRDASSQQQRRRRCGGQNGDDDLRPILHESCEIDSDWQSRPLHKHSRSAYSKAAERGRQIDRYWPDHHCTEVTGSQERHQRHDGIVGKTCHFRGQVHHYCEHRLGAAVTYLELECRSVHDGDRRGFTLKPTAKYVDECLDVVQMQYAKAVMTPLTEQKSLNLHDETTACDQVQHSLFRAVVGKLQYITGVKPDLMFATKCLSYKLA